ncbi:MAG TPA: D-alanyl-D-alanine carboxypeptidase/D-alanyl-D-alanine-endopeptidase, partial [Acidobacteriaceae bacterium]
SVNMSMVRGLSSCSAPCVRKELARHVSPTLLDDVIVTNKVSQNLHAEMLLRQLGFKATPYTSFAQGARVVRQFAINAGVKADDFYFVDGSGLSTYDIATPRAFTALLRYAAAQPWGTDWKASLPVGGVDGTLEHRFTEAPLKGEVFAKTGTLSEDRALSGYLVCASGKTLVFSILVGNHLPGSHEDRDVMDKIVAAIAATN